MLPSIGLEASPDFGYKVHLAKDDYRDDASKLPCPRSEGKKKKRLTAAVLEMKETPTAGWEGERRKQKGEMKGMKKIIGCNFKNEVT